MKKTFKFILRLFCILLLIIIVAVTAYCIFESQFILQIRDGVEYDGFGREILPAPFFFRTIMSHWFGYGWFIIDSLASFILIGSIVGLWNAIKALKEK